MRIFVLVLLLILRSSADLTTHEQPCNGDNDCEIRSSTSSSNETSNNPITTPAPQDIIPKVTRAAAAAASPESQPRFWMIGSVIGVLALMLVTLAAAVAAFRTRGKKHKKHKPSNNSSLHFESLSSYQPASKSSTKTPPLTKSVPRSMKISGLSSVVIRGPVESEVSTAVNQKHSDVIPDSVRFSTNNSGATVVLSASKDTPAAVDKVTPDAKSKESHKRPGDRDTGSRASVKDAKQDHKQAKFTRKKTPAPDAEVKK